MATTSPPKEPLVAILGTTGTGKSDLAVDLALKFDGEIINADAMQMYRGLPIITNQLSLEERRGVPHHLLATINPHEPTWAVDVFAREAKRLIREIRGRGKLPIIVGGTHYYVHSVLFEDNLVTSQGTDDGFLQRRPQEENGTQFPILEGPTDMMLRRLREVDPIMADRWHPDDRRKIRRSLEIFLTTGKRASDIYAEQKQGKAFSSQVDSPWQSLMFWVYTDSDVLKERLNKRVNKMYENGLMEEVRSLHKARKLRTQQGETVDLTRGIWQSIGYKQMESFFEAERNEESPAKLEQVKEAGLELIRIATRQYARQQLRWIRHKSIPAFRDHRAMDHLFILDSSCPSKFSTDVLEPARKICRDFLDGCDLIKPIEVSDKASEVLMAFGDEKASSETFKVRTCEICGTSLQSEQQWEKHTKGRRHLRALRSGKRTSLIPFDGGK
ncbi:tRNA isopentenyltransferase [Hypoxylon trugodes]|uniref:tRNA isopentenyltransferase n=1 Tax=Hypoxylon trugodes TaxID=326681 RepID=UPI0021A2209F|nr:tRNA isopentenyltransferase [Hypoxylon trugodes]KAI1391557.1 tRNA isopentenyltransferase [Hypoxylon trugodes]